MPAPVLLWLVVITVAIGFSLHQGRIETELSTVLPTPNNPKQKLLTDELRSGPFSRLMLMGIAGADPEVLAAASKSLAHELRATGDFVLVANGQHTLTKHESDLLFEHRYLLSQTTAPSQFTPAGLRNALRGRLRELASPLSPLIRQQVPSDPTAAFRSVLQVWVGQDGPRMHNGIWLSKDGGRALLTAETKAPGFDLEQQQNVQDQIRNAFEQTKQGATNFSSLQLVMTGPAIFAVEARNSVREETAWLSLAAILLVVLFLYATYRSVILIGLALVPLLSGMVMSIALVILVVGYIHGITLAFGATLMGVAVDYPIHLFSHLSPRTSPKIALAEIWPTMSLGVITTVIGYCGLLFSGFPGLSELGLFAIIGLATAALVTRWILPGMIPASFHPTLCPPRFMQFMDRTDKVRILPPFILCIAVAFLLISEKTFWERDIANLIPLPKEKREIDRSLREEFSAPEGRTLVVVPGRTQEEVLQRIERLEPLFENLLRDGVLSGYETATRYLPSRESQMARQRDLPDEATLSRNLATALEGLPFKKGAFEPFVQGIAQARNQTPVVAGDFGNTTLGLKLRSLLFHRDSDWLGVVPVRGVSDTQVLSLALAQTEEPGVFHLNLKRESNLIVSAYGDEALIISAWAIFAICLVLFWKLRKLWFLARVVLPIASAVFTVSALLHALGEHFSVFHLASMLLVVGIGLDYSLFFNRSHKTQTERAETTHAITTCVVTTALVFGTLAMSEIPVLQSIGLTVTLGSLTCFLFSCILARKVTLATNG